MGAEVDITANFDGQTPVNLTTNSQGLVVSGNKTTGTNAAALESLVSGQEVEGVWDLSLTFPAGFDLSVVEDVVILLNYHYVVICVEPIKPHSREPSLTK